MLGNNQTKKSNRKSSIGAIIQEKHQHQSNIRIMVNAASKGMFRNVHQIRQNTAKSSRTSQTAEQMRRMITVKQSIDSTVEAIQQKLVKIEESQSITVKSINQINIETMNSQKKRNQDITIPLQFHQNWKIWIGNVFIEVCDRAFQLFLNNELTYEEMKAFCSQKILLNLTQLSRNPKHTCTAEFQQELDRQLEKIIIYLCNKYPQTQKSQINKRLKELTQKNLINNSENDDYDLIDQSGVYLQYNQDEDYSKEIMQFMNYLITLTSTLTQNGNTLYYNFQTFMQNVFSIVELKDKNNDMNLLLKQSINDKQKFLTKLMKQEEIEYQEKVKQYTHYAIGSKIPPNTPLYTEQQMISGHVDIKSKTVARTLDKWTQELFDKMQNSHKSIMERTYRFKGSISGTRFKPNPEMKQILYRNIKQQFQSISQFKDQLCSNVLYLTRQIVKGLPGMKNLSFIPQRQRSMAELACKMEQASVQYSIQTMNRLIHSLLRGVQTFKKEWKQMSQFPQQNIINQHMNVNLVTCKIGDLLRCKFSSKEDEVLRIFQFLLTMSEMNYLGLFKINRIKNRLSQGTRDILINAYFKNKVVCEIQLAVNQSSNHKQSYMDKFNHFLYQLKRAQLGTLMQLCGVWVNYDPKSKTFIKEIEQEDKIKIKARNTLCKKTFDLNENFQVIKFPFICKICKIFHTGQTTIFQNIKFESQEQTICGQCVSSRMENQQRKYYIFKYNQKKNRLQKCFLERIQQIFTIEQIEKNQIFFMIPKNARKINKYYVRKVETGNMVFFVENTFVNGQLQIKTKVSLSKQQVKTYQKKLFQKYCIFIFKVPFLMKKIDFSQRNFLQIVKKDIQALKNPNSNVSCVQLTFDNRNILFPFYKNNNCEENYLKKSENKMFIIKKIYESKQVLQISNRKISSQINQLPKGVLIKMNSTLKQMYLDQNKIQELSFIQHMQTLQILTARNNRLKQIPQIPECLQSLDLTGNQLQKINDLNSSINYKLSILILCSNKISKLQNLQNLTNLTSLILSFNLISRIQNIQMLTKLQKFSLYQNLIEKIENIQNLSRLAYLVIGNSKLQKLQNLRNNIDLIFLKFSNNKIKKIQQISHLNKITKLQLQKNQIEQIQGLQNLSLLAELNLSYNKIRSMKNIQSVLNVRNLNLSNNLIQSINFLGDLYQLRDLSLANNKINKIQGLQQNFMLEKVDLSGNLIKAIINIGHLGFLKRLQLSNNYIKRIQNIEDLSNLQNLSISNNEIFQVVGFPSFIKRINLEKNKIQSVKWLSQFSSKSHIEQINLTNNPLKQEQISLLQSVFSLMLPKIKLQQNKKQQSLKNQPQAHQQRHLHND